MAPLERARDCDSILERREVLRLAAVFEEKQTQAEATEPASREPLSTPGAAGFVSAESWTGSPVLDDERDPLVGATLRDTYVVEGVIGEGGMGRVYRARHTRIRAKKYAIKVLHAELARQAELQVRFQREAEAAASVDHDGVVGTYDVGTTPTGAPYLVCEYLSGRDLHSIIKSQGPLPNETVIRIGLQLCSALQAAHDQGVIHRDLKPHNVFVLAVPEKASAPQVNVKILDFGLSRFVDRESNVTKTGVILGTPGYMAPEQALGEPTGSHTDIYGLGTILYAASTGRPPFREETPQMTVLKVMGGEPPRPRSLRSSIPESLEAVIQRAMARDPSARYGTATELAQALSDAREAPLRSSGAPGATARNRYARARLALLVAGWLAVGVAWALSAVLGALELRGSRYSPTALEWILLGLLGGAFLLPVAVGLRNFRRRVWTNTARVWELEDRLRGPLIASLFAYGVAALVVRVGGNLVAAWLPDESRAELVGNVGWSFVLPLVGALAASAAALRALGQSSQRALVRFLSGPVCVAVTVMASGLLLWLGFAWTPLMGVSPVATGMAEAAEPSLESRPADPAAQVDPRGAVLAVLPTSEPIASAKPPEPPPRASQAELAEAQAGGAEQLEELSHRYPKDSNLLKALVLAHAARADTLPESLDAIRRLLAEDVTFGEDEDVVFILGKALRSKGGLEEAAYAIVRDEMGASGADMLFDVMQKSPRLEKQLRPKFLALRKAGQASPAVSVAYDLKFALSCKARLPLLDRASQHGDRRSVKTLSALIAKPTPCRKRQKCRPQCEEEAAAFVRAIEAIEGRVAGAPGGSP